MVLKRSVIWVTGGAALIVGLAYATEVSRLLQEPGPDNLHWDPRILLVVCAALWICASVILAAGMTRPPRRIAAWILVVSGVAGVASDLFSNGLEIVLLSTTVLIVFTDLSVYMTVLVLITTLAHSVGHALTGGAALTVASAVIGGSVASIGGWLTYEFREWDRQTRLFDQARWAASEYAQVNASMLNRMDQGVEIARLRERERIAREVHDTVGYALTASLVQMRAAQRLLKRNPESAAARMAHIEEMINDSLQDVRREVSNLRDESAVRCVGSSRWRRLCEVFSVSTGIRVSVQLPDDLEVVSEEISEVIYRIIQESLTNAYRHGGADHVDVSGVWKRDDEALLLRVSDNGRGGSGIQPGNGLSGMRERVEALSGTVVWVTYPGKGFDLGIEIPWQGATRGQDTDTRR